MENAKIQKNLNKKAFYAIIITNEPCRSIR